MGILLDRMALFSAFVKKYFTASPRIVSMAFTLACLFIDLPFAFSFKVVSLGDCYWLDESSGQTIRKAMYTTGRSDFYATKFGENLIGFTTVFLNLFLTLVVGISLNIVSVYLYSSYLKQRKMRENILAAAAAAAAQTSNSSEELQRGGISSKSKPKHQLTPREIKDRKAEKNLILMALTLSSISILSRIVFLSSYFVFFIFSINTNLIPTFLATYAIYTIVPSAAIFVFYSFNKIFRKELEKALFLAK